MQGGMQRGVGLRDMFDDPRKQVSFGGPPQTDIPQLSDDKGYAPPPMTSAAMMPQAAAPVMTASSGGPMPMQAGPMTAIGGQTTSKMGQMSPPQTSKTQAFGGGPQAVGGVGTSNPQQTGTLAAVKPKTPQPQPPKGARLRDLMPQPIQRA